VLEKAPKKKRRDLEAEDDARIAACAETPAQEENGGLQRAPSVFFWTLTDLLKREAC
jgi:hypothetical protein